MAPTVFLWGLGAAGRAGDGNWAQGQRVGVLPCASSEPFSFPACNLGSVWGLKTLRCMCYLNQGPNQSLDQEVLGKVASRGEGSRGAGARQRRMGAVAEKAGRQASTAGRRGHWERGLILGAEQSTWREEGNRSDNSKQWAIRKSIMSALEMNRMITFSAGLPSQLRLINLMPGLVYLPQVPLSDTNRRHGV